MSKRYPDVLDYFKRGIWSEDMVRNAVGRWITAEEYEMITGKQYEVAE